MKRSHRKVAVGPSEARCENRPVWEPGSYWWTASACIQTVAADGSGDPFEKKFRADEQPGSGPIWPRATALFVRSANLEGNYDDSNETEARLL